MVWCGARQRRRAATAAAATHTQVVGEVAVRNDNAFGVRGGAGGKLEESHRLAWRLICFHPLLRCPPRVHGRLVRHDPVHLGPRLLGGGRSGDACEPTRAHGHTVLGPPSPGLTRGRTLP